MAVSLSVSIISTSTSSLSLISSANQKYPFSKSHKSLIFPIQSSPIFNHLSISNSLSSPAPLLLHNRHDFRCCFANIMDEGMQEEEDGEMGETGAKKMWESVETLTKYYKEAVLAGDYQTITEIETVLLRLETEKIKLDERLSTLTEEITSGKEKFIRLQADFDNFRRRSEKERLSVRSNAQGEVIESLLPMVDNFERAKQQIKPETDKEKQIDTSYQGIYKQFVEIMRSLRVAVVATVGKPFDPSCTYNCIDRAYSVKASSICLPAHIVMFDGRDNAPCIKIYCENNIYCQIVMPLLDGSLVRIYTMAVEAETRVVLKLDPLCWESNFQWLLHLLPCQKLHEAIAREESEEFKEGIIIQEFRRGFLLGDQLLRPAMVKVSSGPGKKIDKTTNQMSLEQSATAAGMDEH
uniref:Uncharacterized protein n=1 Tax=Chenopodium quinoa TaxID=63459 RepID=A0A803L072_CHEQI